MPQTSHDGSSPNLKPAQKGTVESANQSAANAFSSASSLDLGSGAVLVPPEQEGRRRLTDSYFIERSKLIPGPDQPRQQVDEMEMLELTASIKSRGIKQPLTVRWNANVKKFMVIDGGRRFEAATRLKLEELPC